MNPSCIYNRQSKAVRALWNFLTSPTGAFLIAVSAIQDIVTDTANQRIITFAGVDGIMTAVSINDIIIGCSVDCVVSIGLLQRYSLC